MVGSVDLNVALDYWSALDHLKHTSSQSDAFERDLRAGEAPCVLAKRYFRTLWGGGQPEMEGMAAVIRHLRRMGIGPYRFAQEEAPQHRCSQ